MSRAEERMFNLLMECPPELDSERGNGRASAVDPPWRQHLQSLGAIAKRLDGALERLEEIDTSFSEWAEHCDYFGSDRPEDLFGRMLVVALEDELTEHVRAKPDYVARDVAHWLSANPRARRMLSSAGTWSLCFLRGETHKQRLKVFLSNVMEVIHEQVDELHRLELQRQFQAREDEAYAQNPPREPFDGAGWYLLADGRWGWIYDTVGGRKVMSRALPLGVQPGAAERALERSAREQAARSVERIEEQDDDEDETTDRGES